jgi:4-nitrophenyl phosphatase
MATLNESIDALVCDLDGVVYRGSQPIPGAIEALVRWRGSGRRFLLCTNNSASTDEEYLAKLEGMGLSCTDDEILTSASVTRDVLLDREITGSAYVVGGSGLVAAALAAGLEVLPEGSSETPSVVLVGWDRDFTWDKMRLASSAVRAGAVFFATNPDTTFPAPDGLWPGAGAIVASIEAASGAEAEVMGKPHRPMMEVAARRLRGSRGIAMVGDRNDTDLDGARSMGWTTILTLSGVTDRSQAAQLSPAPDLILESLEDLPVS